MDESVYVLLVRTELRRMEAPGILPEAVRCEGITFPRVAMTKLYDGYVLCIISRAIWHFPAREPVSVLCYKWYT